MSNTNRRSASNILLAETHDSVFADLFDLDLGSSSFDLFLDLFGFGLGDALFEGLRSAFDQRLGFGEAESGDASAHFLDDGDLVGSGFLEDDVERRLLLDRSRGSRATAASGRDGHRSCCADAPLLFELFNEISDFQDGESAELIH